MSKILLIEDEKGLREKITNILHFENFEVISAEYGMNGVEMAARISPDLILMDIQMPSLDGYEVMDQLRRKAAHANIPCVLLTTQADNLGLWRRGEQADEYLTKPFTHDELMNAIRTSLDKQKTFQRQSEENIMEIPEVAKLLIAVDADTEPAALLKLSQLLSVLAGVEAYYAPDREDRIYGGESEQEAHSYIDAIIQTYPRANEEKVQLQEGVDWMIEEFKKDGLDHELARDLLKKSKRRITQRIQMQEPSESVQTFFEKLRKKQETL